MISSVITLLNESTGMLCMVVETERGKIQALADIGFKGLSMRTADHRDTVLEHWVRLHVAVERV